MVFLSGLNDSLVTYQFGKGDGTFRNPVVVPWPVNDVTIVDNMPAQPAPLQVLIQDFNKDGKPDIGVSLRDSIGGNGQASFSIAIFCVLCFVPGSGVGTPAVYVPNSADTHTVAGDFNGSGKTDYVFWVTSLEALFSGC